MLKAALVALLSVTSKLAVPAFSSTTTSRTTTLAFSAGSMMPLLLVSSAMVSSSTMVAQMTSLAIAALVGEDSRR